MVLTVKVSDSYIFSFDGAVLEEFYGAQGHRLHVGHIDKIQIETDNKGKHMLKIQTRGGFQGISVDDAALGQMQEMIAEVQKATAAFQAAHPRQT